jgi:hypothetical protein
VAEAPPTTRLADATCLWVTHAHRAIGRSAAIACGARSAEAGASSTGGCYPLLSLGSGAMPPALGDRSRTSRTRPGIQNPARASAVATTAKASTPCSPRSAEFATTRSTSSNHRPRCSTSTALVTDFTRTCSHSELPRGYPSAVRTEREKRVARPARAHRHDRAESMSGRRSHTRNPSEPDCRAWG